MNFIIEILPKKENEKDFVFLVRAQNGFPISVCETLDGAKDIIQSKMDEALAAKSNA